MLGLMEALVDPDDNPLGELGGAALLGDDPADDELGGVPLAAQGPLDEDDLIVLDQGLQLGEFLR